MPVKISEQMPGAIAGDVIGSLHEHLGTKSMDFELFAANCRFTDDTVLAVAVADCLLNGLNYVDAFHEYVKAYPNAGCGYNLFHWASSGNRDRYNSWGNGAAMRVPAVGHAFDRLEDVLAEAARTRRRDVGRIVEHYVGSNPLVAYTAIYGI